jgi:hypothetical protein
MNFNKNYVWNLIVLKFPHAEWCELNTGLWDECDCGASDKRIKLYERFLLKQQKEESPRQ